MKTDDLYHAVTELRDDQIAEGERKLASRRPARFRRLGALAAVLAVVILAGALTLPKLMAGRITVGQPVIPGNSEAESSKGGSRDPAAPTGESAPPALSGRYTLAAPQYPTAVSYENRSEAEGLDDCLRALLPELLGEKDGKNSVCAPLNVYMALAMLAETTEGESRQEILNLLHVSDLETLRSRGKALWEVNYRDDETVKELLANSLWLRDGTEYNSETVNTLAKEHYASVFSGPMGDPEYTAALRRWMNEQTKGLLADQIDGIELQKDTAAALVSTLYYQASWAEPFYQPAEQIFHGPAADIRCEFMRRCEKNALYEGEGFLAAGTEISGGGAAYFLLPDEGLTPEELLTRREALSFLLTPAGRSGVKNREVLLTLTVPKFDVSDNTDLGERLKRLGVTAVFDPNRSDFGPLVDAAEEPVFLSRAEHGARITVDEKGLTGAAYTVLLPTAGPGYVQLEELELTLDRPFLFVVTNEAGMPIFVGVVNNPIP